MTERSISEPVAVAAVRVVEGAAEVAAGPADADLRRVYGRCSQQMFGFARRLGLSDEDASDAVQETMLRLWRELDAGAEIRDLEAWGFRALYRLAIDHHRFRRRLLGLMDRLGNRLGAGDHRNGGGDPAEVADVDAIWREVDRLPNRQRAVLYLRYRADLPYERIGLALSITSGAARGHASTGLATLRRRLGEEAER